MKKKTAPPESPALQISTVEPTRDIIGLKDLPTAVNDILTQLQTDLWVDRAEACIRGDARFKAGRLAAPLVLIPPTKKSGVLLLEFALTVGRIERSACLDVLIKTGVLPESSRAAAEKALVYHRGPVGERAEAWRFETKWEPETRIAVAQ